MSANAVKGIFEEAIFLEADERHRFVLQACGGNNNLYSAVASMLEHYQQAQTLFDPLCGFSGENLINQSLGAYRISRQLGSGSMGLIYLAERCDNTFYKQVAIKVIRCHQCSEKAIAHFNTERKILASLNHPNIVRLLDAGATRQGLPFYVMDYIDGVQLNQYCCQQGLNLEQRLSLFCKICSAVQAVHTSQVIHCDLKPQNILIDKCGEPYLIDFGISKCLSGNHGLEQEHQHPMTPAYASPEQIKGLPITVASDIFALGCILYELVTHCRPFSHYENMLSRLEFAICTQTPALPSRVVSGVCRGLDTIVSKAMHKNIQARYTSAEQLRCDIECFLRGGALLANGRKYLQRMGLSLKLPPAAETLMPLGFFFLTLLVMTLFNYK